MDKLWVYAKPDTMKDHKFSDDVAITYAPNKGVAYMRFKILYNLDFSEVTEVTFNDDNVAILTDY